jgi:uncharacterized protein YndB with AHSA1/START domain
MSTSPVPDAIEKEVFLRAPRARVWRAISDSKEFGAWFGVEFDAPFAVGAALTGRIVPTRVDAAVAASQEKYRGAAFEISVETIDAPNLFAFRWHPFAVEKGVDYAKEPTTLVVFRLEDAAGGTHLTITESGFARIRLERRARAFAANDGGWAAQTALIAKYIESCEG